VTGLTTSVALQRLGEQGRNVLPSPEAHSFAMIVKDAFLDPMFALLVAAAAIHLALGQLGDSIALLVAVALVIGLSVRQDWKSEKALQALRDLSAPTAFVVRDGIAQQIPAADIVTDDQLLFEAGDRVPADAMLLSATDLYLDESLLTGESVPVAKAPGESVLSGSLVVRGRAAGVVTATGVRTELGKLGHGLRAITRVDNPVERELRTQVRRLAVGSIAVCAVVSLLYAARTGEWLNGILAGLALAIAMVPEEFPVVSKIFLALGAWRLSSRQVLTRNLSALQTLAHTTVLAVDKTGTLTVNQLTVRDVIPIGAEAAEVLHCAGLASDPFALDPIDKAILSKARESGDLQFPADTLHMVPIPMALMQAFGTEERQDVFVKGAPETVAALCTMSAETHERWHAAVERATAQGLKVLGVATGMHFGPLGDEPPDELRPAGLICLLDPLRPNVQASVAQAYQAGLRIVIITGDHAKTAETIAKEAGIRVDSHMSGSRLETMTDAELTTMLKDSVLFSRVTPSQKLRLVTALKQAGETVAMTGDGVNDAAALRAADVGIAMGKRGTDVAREASDLVLVDDEFASLVEAIRMARTIRERFERALRFIIAVHVPIAALALLPLLLGWPLILLPLHIILLELVIDPACSMAFDAEPASEKLMEEPPQRFSTSLFNWTNVLTGTLHGTAAALGVVAVFAISYFRMGDAADSRTLAFVTLLLMDVALIWLFRSSTKTIWSVFTTPNAALWAITCVVVIFIAVATQSEVLQRPLRLVELHVSDYLWILATVMLLVTILDGRKLLQRPAS